MTAKRKVKRACYVVVHFYLIDIQLIYTKQEKGASVIDLWVTWLPLVLDTRGHLGSNSGVVTPFFSVFRLMKCLTPIPDVTLEKFH